MKKFDYKAKMTKLFTEIFSVLFFCGVAYGGYLLYIYKKMPSVKPNVNALYSLFTDGQAVFGTRPAAPQATTTQGGSWAMINARTSDETILRLSGMSDKEIKEKLREVKDYDHLINSNSLQLLKAIARIVSKDKDTVIISGEDETQIKAMLEKIIDDYKNKRIPGIGQIEKETGKW